MKTQQRNTKHTPFAAWDFALRVPESAGILSDFQGRKKKGLQPVLPVQPVQLSLRLHPREILLAQSLITRCRTQLDISLTLTPSLKEHIVEKYSNLKMGARPLKRAIQTLIEDALAEEILSGRVKSGDHVSAGFRENKVVFSVKNK